MKWFFFFHKGRIVIKKVLLVSLVLIMHLPTSGHGAIQLYYNHYSDNLFSFELSGSIFYMEDAGGVTKEHLQTELGDNGIKPEGE